jgi:hypothetical protein
MFPPSGQYDLRSNLGDRLVCGLLVAMVETFVFGIWIRLRGLPFGWWFGAIACGVLLWAILHPAL